LLSIDCVGVACSERWKIAGNSSARHRATPEGAERSEMMSRKNLNQQLRSLAGNLHSSKLPGGSVIAALLNRNLMTWSDRGGASRLFGEVWSERCWDLLQAGDARTGVLRARLGTDIERFAVIRLDANPRIAIQAGRHKLPNPDFVVVGHDRDDRDHVYAVDAKFAVDRIRSEQISPESMESLVGLPSGIVLREIQSQGGIGLTDRVTYRNGLFIGPDHPMNRFFRSLHMESGETDIESGEITLVPVSSGEVFGLLPEKAVIDFLASVDRLQPAGDQDLLSAMYYLRLACAASWFHQEMTRPLLSLRETVRPETAAVDRELRRRAKQHRTAFEVIASWARQAERQVQTREIVQRAASLPLRMGDLRAAATTIGRGEDRKLVRSARGMLEKRYIRRLIDEIGEVPATPRHTIDDVVQEIRKVNRKLQPELRRDVDRIFDRLLTEDG
jgi:hypothetical protein